MLAFNDRRLTLLLFIACVLLVVGWRTLCGQWGNW
jgi:hypothetical protein